MISRKLSRETVSWPEFPSCVGFTLIELLVVIAIIGLLVTMLVPSLAQVQQLAKTLKCEANLHALARASKIYAGENEGYLPMDFYYGCNNQNSGNLGHYSFAAKLSPYVSGPTIPFEHDDDDDYLYESFKETPGLHCPGIEDEEFVLHYVSNGMDYDLYRGQQTVRFWARSAGSRSDRPGLRYALHRGDESGPAAGKEVRPVRSVQPRAHAF
ncbi:MAG: type II secretion system protein [Phycisphaerae bacterium]